MTQNGNGKQPKSGGELIIFKIPLGASFEDVLTKAGILKLMKPRPNKPELNTSMIAQSGVAKTNPDRVRPFYCGSQGADWQSANCGRCKKSVRRKDEAEPEKDFDYRDIECPIEYAIGFAYMDDGSVDAKIGERMGYDEKKPTVYQWECKEREPT